MSAPVSHGDGPPHLPDPTPWPMFLALGMTLLAAGLVTQILLSAAGVALFLVALLMMVREDVLAEDAARGRSS